MKMLDETPTTADDIDLNKRFTKWRIQTGSNPTRARRCSVSKPQRDDEDLEDDTDMDNLANLSLAGPSVVRPTSRYKRDGAPVEGTRKRKRAPTPPGDPLA